MCGRRAVGIGAMLGLWLGSLPALAINIVVDDTYDTNGFFAAGSQARATLNAVAEFYSTILTDAFSPIVTPEPFTSSLPPHENPGTAEWQWTMSFPHPSSNSTVTITNPTVAADEYRLFVGAKFLDGPTLGQGGPGGGSLQSFSDGGFFTTEEIDEIEAIDALIKSQFNRRGQPSGFARWGGVATFDLDADWHFDHSTPPPAAKNDLYTVAMHEIGHALGLSSSSEWTALTAGSGDAAYFFGNAAVAVHGDIVPLAFNVVGGNPVADKAHWREGLMSTVFGSSAAQEALMDPSVNVGTRKTLTALDAAALADIGWTVVSPINLPGDYNGDEVVDAADYTVWRNNLGSPAALLNDDSPGVDFDDYQRWKSNFGRVRMPGGGAWANDSPAIPEPSSRYLVVACAATLLSLRASRRNRSLASLAESLAIRTIPIRRL